MSDRRFEELADHFTSIGIKCTAEDAEDLSWLLWQHCQKQRAGRLIEGSPEVQNDVGKVLGFVIGAVLGAFFLPGLGLASGWLTGALIGGAIGYKLVSLFSDNSSKKTKTTVADTIYQFSGTGDLATLNSAIPSIYGNRDINADGGVFRASPSLIWTKIYVEQGGQWIETLMLLSFGRLGRVDLSTLKLSDFPRSDYGSDVLAEVSPGFNIQPALGGIFDYSQAVAISSNNNVGVGAKLTSATPTIATNIAAIGFFTNGNYDVGTKTFGKAQGGFGWNAGFRLDNFPTRIPDGYGSYLAARGRGLAGNAPGGLTWAIGFSSSPLTVGSITTYEIAIATDGGQWQIYQNGTLIAQQAINWTGDGSIEIRAYRSDPYSLCQGLVSGVEVWRGTFSPANTGYTWANAALHAGASVFREGNAIDSLSLRAQAFDNNSALSHGLGTRFSTNDAGLTALKISSKYLLNSAIEVTIVRKDNTYYWVEFDRQIWIPDMDGLGSVLPGAHSLKVAATMVKYYSAAITTTKDVTAIDVVLKALTWAKNSSGDLVDHGQAFDLFINTGSGNDLRLGRFIIVGKSETATQHTIQIRGLVKGTYKILVRPLPEINGYNTINRLIEATTLTTIATGVYHQSQQIFLITELGTEVTTTQAEAYLNTTNKPSTSGDSSATAQVTHINEIVTPATAPTYPGYTIGRTKILASERIQTVPTHSWDIPKGKICANYLWAGEMWGSGDARYVYGYAPFSALPVGAVLRILGGYTTHSTSVITTAVANGDTFAICEPISTPILVNAGSLVTVTNPGDYLKIKLWMPVVGNGIPPETVVVAITAPNQVHLGNRWGRAVNPLNTGTINVIFNPALPKVDRAEMIAYTMDSSCYFPDIFVDRLIDPVSGSGNFVDENYFVDYESIVKSRKFCVRNNFFFDGVIADGSFEEWAIATAPSSLLYPTTIQGRYALIPQEDAKPGFLFTASNTKKYSEANVPWHSNIANTILMKYQTNAGKERQVKIQTTNANTGIDPEIVTTITCQGVTSRAQAIRIGQVSLKSLILQDRSCQIETDIACGLYTKQGDIVRSQHTAIEYGNEGSGFITSVVTTSTPVLSNVATKSIVIIAGNVIKFSADHQLKLSGNGTTDTIVIAGSTANNGTYLPAAIAIIDERTIVIAGAGNGVGGTATIRRNLYDCTIGLSDPPPITINSRVTLAHQNRAVEADKLITDLGNDTYKIFGAEQPIETNDVYAIGETVSFDRVWRLTSVQPDVKQNSATLTGIKWDSEIMTTTGLVTVLASV
jgi:hypothetical protein